MDRDIKQLNYKKNFSPRNSFDPKLEHVRWNIERSDEMHFDNYKSDYFFFIVNKNPETILGNIESEVAKYSLGFSFDLVNDPKFGDIQNSVNSYVFANYRAIQGPNKINFNWLNIPHFIDERMSKFYRKGRKWDISEYLENLVNN